MGFIREPIDVDFSMKSTPLTEEEHKEISEYIKKCKAARMLAREQRRFQAKQAKVKNTD